MNPLSLSTIAPLFLALLAPARAATSPPQGSGTGDDSSSARAPDKVVPLREIPPGLRRALEARAPCFDADRWRGRLTDPDLDQREGAFQDLVSELARCGEAVNVIETWAASLSEPELCWTSRLALREARRQPTVLVLAAPQSALTGQQQTFSVDPSEPLAMHGRLRSLQTAAQGVFEGGSGLSLYAPRLISFHASKVAESRRSFSLEMGPDAVTLRVLERDGSGERTREFSAASLEALLQEHPELADQVPGLEGMALRPPGEGGGLLRWSTGVVRLRFDPHGWRTPPTAVRLQGMQLDGAEPPTEVLGIECQQASAEERTRREIEPGVGLRVERTIPGTVAYEIELRRGDILVRIGQHVLRDCGDIGLALAERPERGPLALELVDTNGQRRTILWNPPGADR